MNQNTFDPDSELQSESFVYSIKLINQMNLLEHFY